MLMHAGLPAAAAALARVQPCLWAAQQLGRWPHARGHAGSAAPRQAQPAVAEPAAAAPAAAAAAAAEARPAMPAPHLDFDDAAAIFRMRTTGDLLRAYGVLKVCSIAPLVRNADRLVRTSRRVLGDGITFAVMRHSFMRQFCAGEDEADIWPTINMLRANGIRTIIDYAAEDDVDEAAPAASAAPPAALPGSPTSSAAATDASSAQGAADAPPAAPVAVGRTYSYHTEATCDKHVGIFLQAIQTVSKLPGQGFAAIKVTALGNPQLLERMSAALLEIRSLFRQADTDGDGFVDAAEFAALYRQLFPAATDDTIARAFATLDVEGAGRVDIIAWSWRLRLQDLPAIVERIQRDGTHTKLSQELVSKALTREEVGLADALLDRVRRLAEAASLARVKLMLDAEHTYFQPAIDHTTHVLSLEYNRGADPVIFNTYQAYLKGSAERMREDMERARREGYVFAAKLVRGAYVQLERARAARLGYESPIWDTIQQTHANYDACVDALLDEVVSHRAQMMVASHNQASIERTVAGMAARGLAPSGSGVFFGQLLGMADNLTFTLGQNGYESYKYLPFGPIKLVMPYLIRRAHENSAIMGAGVANQMALLRKEIGRRLRHPLAPGGLFRRPAAAAAASQ